MQKRLLAIALLVAATPEAAEVAEAVVHFASYGDWVHSNDGKHQPIGQDEHGCTPSLHLCLCHAGAPVSVQSGSDRLPEALAPGRVPPRPPAYWLGRLADPPPLPPPIV